MHPIFVLPDTNDAGFVGLQCTFEVRTQRRPGPGCAVQASSKSASAEPVDKAEVTDDGVFYEEPERPRGTVPDSNSVTNWLVGRDSNSVTNWLHPGPGRAPGPVA
jgi:hypothetical protein